MAVPKKRVSRSKGKSRFSTWSNKANLQSGRALSLGKSILKDSSKSLIYPSDIDPSTYINEE